jgi:hypothetical protein
MANNSIKLSQEPIVTTVDPLLDRLVLVANASGNASLVTVPVTNIYTNIRIANTPANSSISVTPGYFFADSNYLYISVANNTLKRIPLESW